MTNKLIVQIWTDTDTQAAIQRLIAKGELLSDILKTVREINDNR